MGLRTVDCRAWRGGRLDARIGRASLGAARRALASAALIGSLVAGPAAAKDISPNPPKPALDIAKAAKGIPTKPALDIAKGAKDISPKPALDIAKEVQCLAINIYWEAAFEPEAGKYGVAHVTMNRRDDPRWPGTVCGVVYEKRAFSWTITHPNRKPANAGAWELARIIANKVYFGLDKGRELWRGVTFYHADYVREGIQSAWRKRLVEYVQVGRHIFYRPAYAKAKSKF